MKRLYRWIALWMVAVALCGTAAIGEASSVGLPQLNDYFTERDLNGEWDATATLIALQGDTAVTASHVVSVAGGVVTILDGGVYVLSGTLDDGQVVVDVKDDEKVQLVLNGASITSSNSAAIVVKQADKVFITLAEGTENTLANGGCFEDEGVDAVIWSDEDLTFNGTGTLAIDSPAGDGIDGNDDIKFASGAYVITAAGRGVDSNDSIRIAGGDFTVTTDGTAFRASHTSNDALGYITIWGGGFKITTGGGAGEFVIQEAAMGGPQGMRDFDGEAMTPPEGLAEGEMPTDMTPPEGFEDGGMPTPPEGFEEGEMPTPPEEGAMPGDSDSEAESEDETARKGFKASGDIVVIGGTFELDTADDAFHADGDLLVFDGEITIASSDDGLHADGSLTIVGGTVDITQSSEGLEAEVITVSGGSVSILASDDGMNARSSAGEKETFDAQEGVLIEISGGTLTVNAGGDGIDSNGDLLVTGGTVVVSGPVSNMNGALDYNGTATISGGTVVAAGASGMGENFSDTSTQAAFLVSLAGEAGEIRVIDAQGNVILAAELEKDFETVVISSPELAVGETYTVTRGDASAEITLTDTVTGADSGGMTGAPGNMLPVGGQPEASGEASEG